MKLRFTLMLFAIIVLYACSPSKQIARSARKNVLNDSALLTAHVGISVYDPSAGKYLYNYQGDKYFIPASNVKIPTCYAAMKYLGDSLVGLRYGIPEERQFKHVIVLKPSGDPSFLHKDFEKQPVFDFLNRKFRKENHAAGIYSDTLQIDRWGNGWSWNDYQDSYMAERSPLPIFGNTITIRLGESVDLYPNPWTFTTESNYFDSILNNDIPLTFKKLPKFSIKRDIGGNRFRFQFGETNYSGQTLPFVTHGLRTAIGILSDTLKTWSTHVVPYRQKGIFEWVCDECDISNITVNKWDTIYSQPTDSLLKPMMHRSDNFFAEQSLLMVSNEMLGVMNDAKIIDTLLKKDFKDLPQRPRWADGSGLSRYNLFTPQDFIHILNKMRTEFGMDRIKTIFPTGNEGTLENYYNAEEGYIFAKTGTLSGVVALSGFLYTKKNKLLIFSILVNNHQASATQVRRVLEKFTKGIRDRY